MKWLREKMMVNMRKVRTIEEMVREFETDLSCRMVTASRSQEGLVVIVVFCLSFKETKKGHS